MWWTDNSPPLSRRQLVSAPTAAGATGTTKRRCPPDAGPATTAPDAEPTKAASRVSKRWLQRLSAVPILRVADASVATAWYARLGFLKESEQRFAPGLSAFVTVARGSVKLFLSEHTGDARPDTLISLRVRDVDAIVAEFGLQPEDEPWAREIQLRDPDGNRLRIGAPRQ